MKNKQGNYRGNIEKHSELVDKPNEKICYGSNAPTFSAMLFKKFLEDRVLARSCNLEGRPLCISLDIL